eukprot:CAMPEP_0172547020 /NCGR_PEP_ID=MMETSP1067-20121228/16660_1 /TAXON_ID=265564 ORGANISM="Thalassiosira punctigera, Strain Tpunct2005C2" /NCGR_SAMPLE_ID=MMETSP1067 /ASSEMBLY_ACC=CAM_ASM_000444 /LENGTH=326 /DNA_ID=CAMNT_0013334037 /DNA_START=39 /DNA_END=1019 /DNA_ORIENTATION=-
MAALRLLSTLLLMSTSASRAFSAPQPITSTSDLAIVGCGVLGTSLCKQLLSHPDFASRTVTGITKSTGRHGAIREQVFNAKESGDELEKRLVLTTMEDVLSQSESGRSFTDVVFCAPPSGFEDYPSAVKQAATQLWSGPDGGGSFVFTSSGGVYEGVDGETVTEESPTLDPEKNPRQGRMIYAEREAIEAGGCALRLAGLYTLERGAHNYWLERCQESGVQGRPDGIVNLLHYDDAASACLAALKVGQGVTSKQTYLISDGNPTTRKGICESALKHANYAHFLMPKFNGDESDLRGKVYDGTRSDGALQWRPTYASFDMFMSSASC